MSDRRGAEQSSHAMSRFAAVTEGVIDACQRGLAGVIPDLDASLAAIITQESREADQLITRSPRELLVLDLGGLSDWSLAVLSDLYAAVSKRYQEQREDLRSRTRGVLDTLALGRTELGRAGDIVDKELTGAAAELRARSLDALTRVVDSATASPMLWYQEIFEELGQQRRDRAAALKLRCLAHDVRLHRGANARGLLRELGELWFRAGEGERNLRLVAALLEDDPSDIWAYNWIAIAGDSFGVSSLAREAAGRGLQLIEKQGDTQRIERQLRERLSREPKPGDDEAAARWPDAVAALRAALGRDFDGGTHFPSLELCRRLVPEFDAVPVKRPREAPSGKAGSRGSQRKARTKRRRRR